MKYVLDFKDYCTKVDSDEKDYNESFYRYYILDCDDERVATVWFAQMEDSGNIYSVSVSLTDRYASICHLYITDEDDAYYPNNYEIIVSSRKLRNDLQVKRHCDKLHFVNLIAHTAMDIFKEEEHMSKYARGRNS